MKITELDQELGITRHGIIEAIIEVLVLGIVIVVPCAVEGEELFIELLPLLCCRGVARMAVSDGGTRLTWLPGSSK